MMSLFWSFIFEFSACCNNHFDSLSFFYTREGCSSSPWYCGRGARDYVLLCDSYLSTFRDCCPVMRRLCVFIPLWKAGSLYLSHFAEVLVSDWIGPCSFEGYLFLSFFSRNHGHRGEIHFYRVVQGDSGSINRFCLLQYPLKCGNGMYFLIGHFPWLLFMIYLSIFHLSNISVRYVSMCIASLLRCTLVHFWRFTFTNLLLCKTSSTTLQIE